MAKGNEGCANLCLVRLMYEVSYMQVAPFNTLMLVKMPADGVQDN